MRRDDLEPRGEPAGRLRRDPRQCSRPAHADPAPGSAGTRRSAAKPVDARTGENAKPLAAQRRATAWSAPEQRAEQRGAETPFGTQSRAARGRQLVPPAGGIALAAEQPAALAATQRLVHERIARWVLSQTGDVAHGLPRAECPAMHRVDHRELNTSERIASLHPTSLGPLVALAARLRCRCHAAPNVASLAYWPSLMALHRERERAGMVREGRTFLVRSSRNGPACPERFPFAPGAFIGFVTAFTKTASRRRRCRAGCPASALGRRPPEAEAPGAWPPRRQTRGLGRAMSDVVASAPRGTTLRLSEARSEDRGGLASWVLGGV